jgi:hypothetical protein
MSIFVKSGQASALQAFSDGFRPRLLFSDFCMTFGSISGGSQMLVGVKD